VHRSRTKAKLIARYNETKKKAENGDKEAKKSIEMVRKGEKDISFLDLPAVKLPTSFTEKRPNEYLQELRDMFHKCKLEMDREISDKVYEKLSDKDIEMMVFFLKGWANNSFSPYVSILMKHLAKRNNEDYNKISFEFKDK
jgi:sulfur relay (sulfurtransferase) DsrC/TusE family protein